MLVVLNELPLFPSQEGAVLAPESRTVQGQMVRTCLTHRKDTRQEKQEKVQGLC